MSLSSAEPLRLVLAASSWRLHTPAGSHDLSFDGDPVPALLALEQTAPPRRGARLSIELGDAWLRYMIVRWPPGLRSARERQLWVAARFRTVHGIAADDWSIVVDRQHWGEAAFACAVPRTLVDALGEWARRHRLRVDACGGAFLQAYNRAASRCASDHGAFALCRDGRLTVASWAHGQWRRVRSEPSGAQPAHILARTLTLWSADAPAGEPGSIFLEGLQPAVLPPGWSASVVGVAA